MLDNVNKYAKYNGGSNKKIQNHKKFNKNLNRKNKNINIIIKLINNINIIY